MGGGGVLPVYAEVGIISSFPDGVMGVLFVMLFACRIVNMIAEDNAIEDTLYYLGEALRKKVIKLDVFLKVSIIGCPCLRTAAAAAAGAGVASCTSVI